MTSVEASDRSEEALQLTEEGSYATERALSPLALRRVRRATSRESARHWLVRRLISLIGLVLLAVFFGISRRWLTPLEARDLLTAILSPLLVLLGTAVSFYFSNPENDKR